jgi:hypothetical protein
MYVTSGMLLNYRNICGEDLRNLGAGLGFPVRELLTKHFRQFRRVILERMANPDPPPILASSVIIDLVLQLVQCCQSPSSTNLLTLQPHHCSLLG